MVHKKKINLTGAVSVVDSKSMEDRPVPRVSQMLQGALPNVNVSFTSGYPGSCLLYTSDAADDTLQV